MNIKHLAQNWTEHSKKIIDSYTMPVQLRVRNAARIKALSELYEGVSESELINDLLNEVLNELEGRLPYKAGSKIIALDELGDPIYEDIGLTPQFEKLSAIHAQYMRKH